MKWIICGGLLSVLWLALAHLELMWWEQREEKDSGEEDASDGS